MKTISRTAIVALLTASVGLTAIAPVWAQETTSPAQIEAQPAIDNPAEPGQRGFRPFNHGPRRNGDFGNVLNVERGAENVEVALVRLGYRLDLTSEQQALLDALKTSAIAAARDFAGAAENLRPTPPSAGETPAMPDISTRLENRIALEKARLAALEAVQPAAEAFFDSLTEAQQAQLAPRRPDQGWQHGRPGQHHGFGQHGPRHGGPAGQPAPGAAPEAPEAPQG